MLVSCLLGWAAVSWRRQARISVSLCGPHQLMASVVEALGDGLQRVEIVDVRDGIFWADLHFESGTVVSARPSDAIALALRTGALVYCTEDVLDDAGLIPEPDEEAEVERFREFLDDVDPDDFA